MNLIIVESPTKARTIQKFLGKDYSILSSFGHVRDLPKKELGIDVENDFEPKYVVPLTARKKITPIKKALEKAERIILATDADREGEAISWHLKEVLKLDKNAERIVFHEITKGAVQEALEHPRKMDMDLVDAQQARRILDRLVGYKISPFLWKKVAKGLSAGRVQSVAARLIVEREREILNFKPEEYWSVEAILKKMEDDDRQFSAFLIKKGQESIGKLDIKTKENAEKIVKDLENAKYEVASIEKKETIRNPLPPFKTSTLQQEAGKRLHFSAKMTMSLAQNLYESGYITYHRTDSLNLSDISLSAAQKFIAENFGQKYWAGEMKKFKTTAKGAQEAHEAIRPTDAFVTPEKIKQEARSEKYGENLFKLYDLIWRRFMASQMSQAVFDSMAVDISAKDYLFRANGQTLKFDGFLKVYPMKFQEVDLPELHQKEPLNLVELKPEQHFTAPPGRYSEATLIKELEKEGIGRPSTYASIISTIQDRNYVQKDQNQKLFPTEIGMKVNDILVEHFPEVVDIKFTANMEEDLDKIAEGEKKWRPVIKEFYGPFSENLEKKYEEVKQQKVQPEPTDRVCPQCESPVVIRTSRFGKFYACSSFPKCRWTEPISNSTGVACPKCGEGQIIEKRSKRGKIFYACSAWPKCDFALWNKPNGEKCEKCGSLLVLKPNGKTECSNKECRSQKKHSKEESEE
ncbi:MAG: type I DNA topoisomerase [Candidatus Portnoybacteria bacterium]|nr:type I DNA topoisomerase [Candidatus Portnoybacteria bacterium]